jgi:hypothetical protein
MKQATWLSALCIATAAGAGLAGTSALAAVPPPAPGAAALAQAYAAAAAGFSRGVSVTGTVTTPATYSLAQLQAMPQTTFAVPARGGAPAHSDQGVSVEQLVESAVPVVPAAAKNGLLRVLVTVTPFAGPQVTFAVGELDPSFGNHPAYLVLKDDGRVPVLAPELVVPGDSKATRTVAGVKTLSVAVENPTPTTPAHAGDLKIDAGLFTTVLSAAELHALPTQTLHVSFAAGTSPQTHTETGPTLNTVLAAAHIPASIVSWVAGVSGIDGYVTSVTPAEATVGGRPLLISTTEDGVAQVQPRLVTDGDVKGGRYNSGLADLVVGYPAYLSFLGLATPLP